LPDPLVIAHLTDPHLPLGTPRIGDLMGKRALSYANWLRRRRRLHRPEIAAAIVADLKAAEPDAIAMTGDLVNFSLESEFQAGAAWLRDLGPPELVGVIPGNHEGLTRGFTQRMMRHWAPYLSGDDGRPGFPWLRRRGPVALIGLSSAVATPPLMASGRVGAEQCAALDRILETTGREGLCRVILVHHAPTEMSIWRKALRDRAALVDVIQARGAELILHGHTHRADLSWIDTRSGRVPVIGAPSASMTPLPGHDQGAWRRLAIERASNGWHLTLTERRVTRVGTLENGAALHFALPGGMDAGAALAPSAASP